MHLIALWETDGWTPPYTAEQGHKKAEDWVCLRDGRIRRRWTRRW